MLSAASLLSSTTMRRLGLGSCGSRSVGDAVMGISAEAVKKRVRSISRAAGPLAAYD